jgi:monoamine oxidase
VVGSGPAGLAAAQQLARAGHDVTVFEKNSRIGGLLRYGIPDFKMEKSHIDRRVEQMKAEGVTFRTGVLVGAMPKDSQGHQRRQETVSGRAAEGRVRRRAADRWRGAVARPAGAGARARRCAFRDGVPAAAEQGGGRRQGQGPDHGHRQACDRDRRRRHRQRLRGHQQPPRRGQRDPVRADAACRPSRRTSRWYLAVLADQAAHQFQPRGGLRPRVRHRHQGVSWRAPARTRAAWSA